MDITHLKFIYSEKATKFCEIFTLLLTTVHTVKSKKKISQNFMALSEYMNFITLLQNTRSLPWFTRPVIYSPNSAILHFTRILQ